jgi:hypothetical protein
MSAASFSIDGHPNPQFPQCCSDRSVLYCTDEYQRLNNNAANMDDAKALSASWLFLSAKKAAWPSNRQLHPGYPRFHRGLQLLRRYQREIAEVTDER